MATSAPYVSGAEVETPDTDQGQQIARHIEHMNPWRLLAECEAKRRIVRRSIDNTGVTVADDWPLIFLAQPYADHPDFREEWRA